MNAEVVSYGEAKVFLEEGEYTEQQLDAMGRPYFEADLRRTTRYN